MGTAAGTAVGTAVPRPLEGEQAAASGASPAPLDLAARLDALRRRFGSGLERVTTRLALSSFERDLLVLLAGVELDGALAGEVARAGGATFAMALSTLAGAHWSALHPGRPLRRWRLVEFANATGQTASPAARSTGSGLSGLVSSALQLDEAILHHLLGLPHEDERLRGVLRRDRSSSTLPAPPAAVEALRRRWAQRELGATDTAGLAAPAATAERIDAVVQLCGADAATLRAIAASAAKRSGRALETIAASDLPAAPAEREAIARLVDRHAAISDAAILIEAHPADPAEMARAIDLAESLSAAVAVAVQDAAAARSRPVLRIEVDADDGAAQESAWTELLGAEAAALRDAVAAVSAQFRLGALTLRSAAVEFLEGSGDLAPGTAGEGPHAVASAAPSERCPPSRRAAELWDACRRHAGTQLQELAPRVRAAARWEDLVLPAGQLASVRDLAAAASAAVTVHGAWGFATGGAEGRGITALFAGPSGTGKTLAAAVVANALRLDLHRVDLSAVVSKYIGETEKNLRRVFDAAEEGGAVLLFDEADALFGRRTEVRDSHDRFANIEVSYLLQRMERFRGVAILTTNARAALDPAFLRRLRFVIEFPFPDAAMRERIWRLSIPPTAPTAGLDFARLARLPLAGGSISGCALHAAYLAAAEGSAIRMQHLHTAVARESAKLERPLGEAGLGVDASPREASAASAAAPRIDREALGALAERGAGA